MMTPRLPKLNSKHTRLSIVLQHTTFITKIINVWSLSINIVAARSTLYK